MLQFRDLLLFSKAGERNSFADVILRKKLLLSTTVATHNGSFWLHGREIFLFVNASINKCRWAVKEALNKAIGDVRLDGKEIDLVRVGDQRSPPALRVCGKSAEALVQRNITDARVSISHDGGVAMAVVILECSEPVVKHLLLQPTCQSG